MIFGSTKPEDRRDGDEAFALLSCTSFLVWWNSKRHNLPNFSRSMVANRHCIRFASAHPASSLQLNFVCSGRPILGFQFGVVVIWN
jgi:hypothetical protein